MKLLTSVLLLAMQAPRSLTCMPETWLVEPKQRAPSGNVYVASDKHVQPLEGIVLHYTASRNFLPTLNWLQKTPKKYSPVSAHFLLDRDGTTVQLAPLEARTWHAGGATSKFMGAGNTNGRTLGIELMNIGPLKSVSSATGTVGFLAMADNKGWSSSGVQALDGGFWEPYPTSQIDALVDLLELIYKHQPQLREVTRLVGHDEVDPTRKRDPGKVFPWLILRQRLGLIPA